MSGLIALAKPRRIKASHRRRGKVASGPIVQRYYDPSIGRFLSVDPVTANSVNGSNFNRYWYANNNPYRFTDLDGRETGAAYRAIYIADQKRGTQQPAGRAGNAQDPNASRYNNPQLANNVMTGEGVGLMGGIVVGVALVGINIAGFPEVEGTELLMAIAGEPIVTPFIVGGTAGAGAGAIAGGAVGIAATEKMSPKPTAPPKQTTPPTPEKPTAPPPPQKPTTPPPPEKPTTRPPPLW